MLDESLEMPKEFLDGYQHTPTVVARNLKNQTIYDSKDLLMYLPKMYRRYSFSDPQERIDYVDGYNACIHDMIQFVESKHYVRIEKLVYRLSNFGFVKAPDMIGFPEYKLNRLNL